MRGTFNIFQRTMLDWNRIHPYNAVHVVRVLRPLDSVRFSAVVDRVMEQSGLNSLVIDPQRRHYEYQGGQHHYDVRQAAGGGALTETLEREMERELNEPFERGGTIVPVRFFTVDGAGGF